jgi:hypothetical protein
LQWMPANYRALYHPQTGPEIFPGLSLFSTLAFSSFNGRRLLSIRLLGHYQCRITPAFVNVVIPIIFSFPIVEFENHHKGLHSLD